MKRSPLVPETHRIQRFCIVVIIAVLGVISLLGTSCILLGANSLPGLYVFTAFGIILAIAFLFTILRDRELLYLYLIYQLLVTIHCLLEKGNSLTPEQRTTAFSRTSDAYIALGISDVKDHPDFMVHHF